MNVTIQPCALLSAVGSVSCVNPRCTAESLLLFTASPRIVTSQAHLEFCFAPVDASLQRVAAVAKLVSKLPSLARCFAQKEPAHTCIMFLRRKQQVFAADCE